MHVYLERLPICNEYIYIYVHIIHIHMDICILPWRPGRLMPPPHTHCWWDFMENILLADVGVCLIYVHNYRLAYIHSLSIICTQERLLVKRSTYSMQCQKLFNGVSSAWVEILLRRFFFFFFFRDNFKAKLVIDFTLVLYSTCIDRLHGELNVGVFVDFIELLKIVVNFCMI